jgi:RND family efflux transporter MFP subunit
MQDTSIYPRASGYLKRLLVDIGDKVKERQLLAEIDDPEVDAQLRQAEANLVLAQANYKKAQDDANLAETTLKRYENAPPGGITQQDLDERRAALQTALATVEATQASIKANQATVDRLTAEKNFQKIIAPFDGTITARNFDIGALLMPTTTPGARELLRIEETDMLRVFVNVPQPYVTSIKIGQQASLNVRNYAGKEFTGTVTRTAGALDPVARTLRYQIDVPNKDGSLYAGMYGQVRLPVTAQTPPILVPTSALVFDSAGTRVWVVELGDVARSKKVEVGRDYGTDVEIASGITPDERVVANPGTKLSDGAPVTVARKADEALPSQSAQAR